MATESINPEPKRFSQFIGHGCISLETYRRSGEAVRTPVWFVEDQGVLLVRTDRDTGKAKRIRHNPSVKVAPCTFRGTIKGSWVEARAEQATVDEAERAYIQMKRKYGLQYKLGARDFGRWIEAADRAQSQAFAHLARPICPGRVLAVEHGVLFSTGLPSRTFNGLCMTRLPVDPDEAISSARKFAEKLRVPWSLSGRAEILDHVAPSISSAGLQQFDSEPGMILGSIGGTAPVSPDGLSIMRVRDVSGIRSCFLTVAAAYEIPPGFLAPLLEDQVLQAYSDDPALSFHIGYVGRDAVAASVGVAWDRVSYVFMVGTIPAFRRRGFGEALTWSAVDAGRANGGMVSYLRATNLGKPLYERMGYREATRHVSFSLPE